MRLLFLLVVRAAASDGVVLDLIVDSAHAAARADLLTSQQFHDAIARECRLRSASRSAWSRRCLLQRRWLLQRARLFRCLARRPMCLRVHVD